MKPFAIALALAAAVVTLSAQHRLTAIEATTALERGGKSFSDARYEEAYRQYNEVFSNSDSDLAVPAQIGRAHV